MGRMYVATFDGVSITNGNGTHDFFELKPGDDHPIILHSLELGFTAAEGDSLEDYLRVSVIRGCTVSGGSSGGTAVTNANMPRLDPQAPDSNLAASMEHCNTAVATGGTLSTLWATTFNIRTGLEKVWTPETRPKANQGNTSIIVRLMAALDADDVATGTLVFEEL